MGVIPSPPYADGQVLTANGAGGTAGLNQSFADCLSLSSTLAQTVASSVTFNGAFISNNTFRLNGAVQLNASLFLYANGTQQGIIAASAPNGLTLLGDGSVNDFLLSNALSQQVMYVQSNTQTASFVGDVTVGIAGTGTMYTGARAVNTVVSTSNYTMQPQDEVVVINKPVGSASSVALPFNPVKGRMVTVKDGKGDAASNNIQIVAGVNIDAAPGNPGVKITTAWGTMRMVYNGTIWNVI